MAKLLTQVAWGGGEQWTEDGSKRRSEDAAWGNNIWCGELVKVCGGGKRGLVVPFIGLRDHEQGGSCGNRQ